MLQKKNIPALKESGLASTGKPSAAERIQQGIPSTAINLSDNRKIVNYFIIPPSIWIYDSPKIAGRHTCH